ncbi:hypothetical protein KAT67_03560 [candidate division WOR-3 bacterium]|jgi:uncharacterized membrane protein|uniref:DUF3098 domain-containing protein n=1 Tax=marine sediment metagenome TaxID=412755 RepID=X1GWR0_9ZZZZ|nr:hypothetical protein [candidate division WOR-3 bacterium]MCK4755983.1 hypothetical protein [candidate division WOR-3 bacterium]
MAKKKEKKKKKEQKEQKQELLLDIKFSKKNTMFFGIGLILVIIGFILLAAGDITLAPIVLVVGYLVFFPLGILLK